MMAVEENSLSLSPYRWKIVATSLWQRWLSPQELVRDKERAGKIQILDTQLFAKKSLLSMQENRKSDQRAALLGLSKVKLSEGRRPLKLVYARSGWCGLCWRSCHFD